MNEECNIQDFSIFRMALLDLLYIHNEKNQKGRWLGFPFQITLRILYISITYNHNLASLIMIRMPSLIYFLEHGYRLKKKTDENREKKS